MSLMRCPGCGDEMVPEALVGQLGSSITINRCLPCQFFWFDTYESLQLAPTAILTLFELIGGQMGKGRPDVTVRTGCPRCQAPLLLTHDWQRTTKFQYWRCDRGHGRLIAFYDFLREKDFIHPLSPQEIAAIRERMQSVTCVNCGAPIDLGNASRCEHCGTPISVIDVRQGERLIAALQQAARTPGAGTRTKAPGDEDPTS